MKPWMLLLSVKKGSIMNYCWNFQVTINSHKLQIFFSWCQWNAFYHFSCHWISIACRSHYQIGRLTLLFLLFLYHRKYTSLKLSGQILFKVMVLAAYANAIINRIYFFCSNQQNKSAVSNAKSRQPSRPSKGAIETWLLTWMVLLLVWLFCFVVFFDNLNW